MQHLRSQIASVGKTRVSVLLLGESGVGKELVARELYAVTQAKHFVPIDCGALAESLVESELFGYVAGAFTGAVRPKDGLMTVADGGTAFFDEIGEMPLHLQAKLLRVLAEREYRPLGAVRPIRADIRVIAATNRDLEREVRAGRFREDLYYRINVISLNVPPLRERKEDIPTLSQSFLEKLSDHHALSWDALNAMSAYDWPGNVRELRNCIEYMVALSSSSLLRASDLPLRVKAAITKVSTPHDLGVAKQESLWKASASALTLTEHERRLILAVLAETDGDRVAAARILGIGRTTLYRKLKEYGYDDGPPRAHAAGAGE